MPPGTVVIAGRPYPVTGFCLRDGKIIIIARGSGPSPELSGPATVFGEDGTGICQAWCVRIPRLRSWQSATVELPMQITHMEMPGGSECTVTWE